MPLSHPRLADLWAYLVEVRAALAADAATLTPDDWSRAPADGGWTPAQVVEHLGRVEGSIAKMFEVVVPALPEPLPADPATDSVRHLLDHVPMHDRTQRIQAPARVAPADAVVGDEAWARLLAVRQRLLAALQPLDGRDLGRWTAPHPLFGPLSGYQWILLVGQHEARHHQQLREVLGR